MRSTAELTFEGLVQAIQEAHGRLGAHAVKAVNISLTLRNWLIGCYIEEYERRGLDRAAYGERLMDELAARLTQASLSNCNRRQLYRYRDFYRTYPGIMGTLSPQFAGLLLPEVGAGQEMGTLSPLSDLPLERLANSLSYSHFELLVEVEAAPLRGLLAATIDGKPAVVEYEPGPDLRDTEQVLPLEEGGIEAFLRREVLPYAPDAWFVLDSIKIGWVGATHASPLPALEDIHANILSLEKETEELLDEIIEETNL